MREHAIDPAVTGPATAWTRTFPATADQLSHVRRLLASSLNGSPITGEALICLNELVSNAILHSNSRLPGGQVTVRATIAAWGMRVEVEDDGGPWQQRSQGDDQAGRGLLIVTELARAWSVTEGSSTRRIVWFEIGSP